MPIPLLLLGQSLGGIFGAIPWKLIALLAAAIGLYFVVNAYNDKVAEAATLQVQRDAAISASNENAKAVDRLQREQATLQRALTDLRRALAFIKAKRDQLDVELAELRKSSEEVRAWWDTPYPGAVAERVFQHAGGAAPAGSGDRAAAGELHGADPDTRSPG